VLPVGETGPIPDWRTPSDHLPIGATLAFKKTGLKVMRHIDD